MLVFMMNWAVKVWRLQTLQTEADVTIRIESWPDPGDIIMIQSFYFNPVKDDGDGFSFLSNINRDQRQRKSWYFCHVASSGLIYIYIEDEIQNGRRSRMTFKDQLLLCTFHSDRTHLESPVPVVCTFFLSNGERHLQAQSHILYFCHEWNKLHFLFVKFALTADDQGPNVVGSKSGNNPRLFGQRRLKLKLK